MSNCEGGGAEDCDAGQEGCACLQGQCFGALQCLSGICVDLSASGNPSQVTTDDPPNPTANPTADPSSDPTAEPTTDPTADPTDSPTNDPTNNPTNDPTSDPTTTTDATTGPPVDDTTTDDPPPGTTGEPKPNDPQPASGMYSDCLNKECEPPTDGCFTVNDPNLVKLDGICSIFCDSVEDCLPVPYSQATVSCVPYSPNQKGCVLFCVASDEECPIGMTCREVNISGMLAHICT